MLHVLFMLWFHLLNILRYSTTLVPFKNAFSRCNLTSQEQSGEVQLFPGILSAQENFHFILLGAAAPFSA